MCLEGKKNETVGLFLTFLAQRLRGINNNIKWKQIQ